MSYLDSPTQHHSNLHKMFHHHFLFQTKQFNVLFFSHYLDYWCHFCILGALLQSAAWLTPSQVPLTNVSPLSVSSAHIVVVPSLLSFPPASRSHVFSFYNNPFPLAYIAGSIPMFCSPPLSSCSFLPWHLTYTTLFSYLISYLSSSGLSTE